MTTSTVMFLLFLPISEWAVLSTHPLLKSLKSGAFIASRIINLMSLSCVIITLWDFWISPVSISWCKLRVYHAWSVSGVMDTIWFFVGSLLVCSLWQCNPHYMICTWCSLSNLYKFILSRIIYSASFIHCWASIISSLLKKKHGYEQCGMRKKWDKILFGSHCLELKDEEIQTI